MEKLVTQKISHFHQVLQNGTTSSNYPYEVIPGWSFILIIVGFIALVMVAILILIAVKTVFDKIVAKIKNEKVPVYESFLKEREKHQHELKSVEVKEGMLKGEQNQGNQNEISVEDMEKKNQKLEEVKL